MLRGMQLSYCLRLGLIRQTPRTGPEHGPKPAAEPVPLADVEAAWSRVEKGSRIVFTV